MGPPGVFAGGPAVVGHRGLGCGVVDGHAENTLGSFTAAAALGAPWVEVDVRRTADDVLVVAHDVGYADGTRIVDQSAAETDQRGTLRLDALLDALPPDIGIDLDLKTALADCQRPPERTTAGLLAPVAAEEARRRPLLVSSFDPAALAHLRAAAPHVPLGWLTWYRFPLELAVAGCAHLEVDVLGVHVGSMPGDPRTGVLDAEAAAAALSLLHGCGRELLVWCPEPDPARLLAEAGADAVVVDDVPGALGVLGRVA